jgi:indolepyruvate ferredoxin oxidoreductase beta subunit
MLLNMIITGVGGQGNVLVSQVIGKAAVSAGYRVTIGETFGLSQRGGPVMSHVRISRDRTTGPLIPPNRADLIMGLEPLETTRVLPEFGNDQTVVLVNSRPIHPLNVISGEVDYPALEETRNAIESACGKLYWLDASDEAIRLGAPILLNMIMLGAVCALDVFPFETQDFIEILGDMFPESKIEINKKALAAGKRFIDRGEA